VRVESATDPLELGAALDLVAEVDDVAAGVDLLEFELRVDASSASCAVLIAIAAAIKSNSTLDLKEGSYGIDAGLRH
jgi:hypothetical protein